MPHINRSILPLLTLCLGILLTCSASPAANLLVNGDFATGDLTGWTVNAPPGQVGVSYSTVVNSNAVYAADNNQTGYLSQTFATNIGDTYDVSFLSWADVLGGGYTTDNINGGSPFFYGFLITPPSRDLISTEFVATSTSTTLNIGFQTQPGEGTAWFADASVTDATVPEPACLPLALSGVLALGAFGRKMRMIRFA